MRVRWSKPTLADLRETRAWLSTLPKANEKRTIARIRAAAENLTILGDIGRPSGVENLRELSVQQAPYILVFRREADSFVIAAVFHMATSEAGQNRPLAPIATPNAAPPRPI